MRLLVRGGGSQECARSPVCKEMKVRSVCLAVLAALLIAPLPARPTAAVAPQVAAPAAPGAGDGLVTYHYDLNRSGYDPNQPSYAGLNGKWTMTVDGDVYAEPLVRNGRVYIATQNDSVYAFNTSDGSLAWHQSIGTARSGTYCGSNINPEGIESTPVIDTATGYLYVVGLTMTPTPAYRLFALDTNNSGSPLGGVFPVTLSGGTTNIDLPHYQQRPALAFNNGRVYIAYGGWAGDCPPYHGTVQAVSVSSGAITQWQVPNNLGGIWGPGGPAVDTASGNVFVATGNDSPPNCNAPSYMYGDSVVELDPTAQSVVDYFGPHDWCPLANADKDIGSINPAILGTSGLVFIGGKNGYGYLLRQSALGHLSPDLAHDGVYRQAICGGEVLSATAYAPPYLYVSCNQSIYALNVDTVNQTFSIAWNAGSGCWAPLVAGGVLWAIDSGGNLNGWNASTGSSLFTPVRIGNGGGPHFVSPSVSGGRVFAAVGTSVVSYSFGPPPVGGSYHPISPTRIWDSRNGGHSPLGQDQAIDVPVASWISGTASAAVINVTVTGSTAPSSFVAVYPAGSVRPNTSNVNFLRDQTIAALTQVQLGAGGNVTVYNSLGTTDFVLDLNGWYDTGPAPGNVSGLYQPLASPVRILDTRSTGVSVGQNPYTLQVSGVAGVPAGAAAVVANVTAVSATNGSFISVYPADLGTVPNISNLNFPPGSPLPNRAIVRLSPSGAIKIFNAVGTVHVIVDVAGYFTGATSTGGGFLFHAEYPQRLLDTRTAGGQYSTPWPSNASRNVTAAGLAGVPGSGVAAVVVNVTITQATAGSYLTVFPAGTARPVTSDLNFGVNWTIANQAVAGLGSGGQIAIYNNGGNVHVILDVEGWYS